MTRYEWKTRNTLSVSLGSCFLACAVLTTLAGCGGGSDTGKTGESGGAVTGSRSGSSPSQELPPDKSDEGTSPAAGSLPGKSAATGDTKKSEPFRLGDLVAPFEPPTLAEIDAQAEWVDLPVVDSTALLRDEYWKDKPEPKPLAEALALRNTTADTNEILLNTLGRMPADEKQANWDASINRHTAADVKSTRWERAETSASAIRA